MTRLIVVEDDPMISEIYRKKFSESGFEVFCAASGEEVLKFVQKNEIDVVLLDLVMPKMDGFEVIRELRSGPYDRNLQIIVSSNMSQREDREKALQLGADGFIAKSEYNPSELVKEVERLAEQFREREINEARRNGLAKGSGDSAGKKRILMIEDEEIFIEMFGEKLKQEGFDVTFANNGAWGLKLAMEGNYDMYIIDMAMPVMSGDEILAKLRLEDRLKDVPAVVLSATKESGDVEDLEQLGVEAFLMKTQITPSQLAKKVWEILK